MSSSISSSRLSSGHGARSGEGVKKSFFSPLAKKVFISLGNGEKRVVFLMHKWQNSDLKDTIDSLAKAVFYSGYFVITGSLIIALGIVKPQILTWATLMVPLLFFSPNVQMVFWIAIGTLALWVAVAIFVKECPSIRAFFSRS